MADLLTAREFYTNVAAYMASVDPHWMEDRWMAQAARERDHLPRVLGDAHGRTVLDCSCGDGAQAVTLAQLGWQVTATDVTETSLAEAQRHADQLGVTMRVQRGDMRDLDRQFPVAFDWVISCMALDNLIETTDLQRAIGGMIAVLKPGGWCYLRLRDLEHLLSAHSRYDVREERNVPSGRVIHLEDWDYTQAPLLENRWIFLHEHTQKRGYRWETHLFAYRRQVLTKGALHRHVQDAGFTQVVTLPQPSPWAPYEVVARKAVAPA